MLTKRDDKNQTRTKKSKNEPCTREHRINREEEERDEVHATQVFLSFTCWRRGRGAMGRGKGAK